MDKTTGNVREYDLIQYRHGYLTGAPTTVCKWGGTVWCEEEIKLGPYRNGFECTFIGGVWAIVNVFD